MRNNNYTPLLLFFSLSTLFYSCTKVDVTFEADGNNTDPNITYLEDYKVDVSTYKLDSFITSGHSVFMLGTHNDTSFAKISSNSYAEVEIPLNNTVKDKDVIFDSLVLVLLPNGKYYGDTSSSFKLSVYELQQNIENEDTLDNSYYYPRKFAYGLLPGLLPIGSTTTTIRPNRNKEISIRLSDAIGQDWLYKLKRNKDEIQSQDDFRDFFKGVCITTDSLFNNILYYFTSGANNVLIRLHYKEMGTILTDKVIGFPYRSVKQFNNITYNYSNSPFAIFSPYKKQVKNSSLMRGKTYVSNNIPCYSKITFPNILALKELYPYVKILKAELEIKPAPGTFSYPYQIPATLRMYTSNRDNNFDAQLADATGQQAQTGNLFIDDLYGEKTKYTFDVTNFVNDILKEGRFSTKALFLGTNSQLEDNETSRLVINEQENPNGIKLKLYVLGL
jgi:Domain of unknown function (DUF4270)